VRASVVIASVCLASLATAATSPVARIPPPPLFPKGNTSDMLQGVRVADPYRALENAADPKVQAWSKAQNARTRAYLDAIPGRAAVAAKVARFLKDTSPILYHLQARGPSVFSLYMDFSRQQSSLVALNAGADPSSRRALLDPNVLDPTGHTAIDWFVASPDGGKVAVSLSSNGSEIGTLHIIDASSGKENEPPIDRVQYPTAGGAVAWTGDGTAFWYTRYPDESAPQSERAFNQAVYLHRLGTAAAHDKLVLSAQNGLPRTGEVFLDNSGGGNAAVACVQLGDGGQWLHYVLMRDGSARQISLYADKVIGGAVIGADGTIYAVSRSDAPMGKVLKLAAPYTGGFAHAATIVAPERGAAIVNGGEDSAPLVLAGHRLIVARIAGGPGELTAYDLSGGSPMLLSLPPVSTAQEIDALPNGDVLYRVNSFLEPLYFARWNAATGRTTRTGITMISPVSFADAQVTQVFATSKDGTKIPLSIISKKGIKLDGSHPALLTGYGGYGINQTPSFAGGRTRLWLDGGGVYAEAVLRGGGEYGETWHQQGMLTKKQNVFDDFDAAAEAMISLGYTTHARLALIGGSNGGLLMGAMITQHPDLARAVVSQVGIYDMLRVEHDPNGAFNVSEFGTVQDPAQFKALYEYSPYHNVRPKTAYPAVLMMTGAQDGRVNPMHSRKFTAALQAATISDRPILLRTDTNSGHGMGSSLDEEIAEIVDRDVFLFDQLGMDATKAAFLGGKAE